MDNVLILLDKRYHLVDMTKHNLLGSAATFKLFAVLFADTPVILNHLITVTEKKSKTGIRLYKGSHEYPKAYKGSTLLWDANDENMEDTGLHIPDKIINRDWD